MTRNLRWWLFIFVAFLAAACSGDDESEPTSTPVPPTAPAVLTPTVGVTPESSPIPPPPTAPPSPTSASGAVAKTVWLIDVPEARSYTLAEEFDSLAVTARFSADAEAVYVTVLEEMTAYALDGSEIGPVATGSSCRYTEQSEQIEGRWHPSFECDSPQEDGQPFLSPNERWWAYRLADTSATSVFPPISEMWALNLESGERHLLHEMQDCGGCDGRFSPSWSPSGRFYVFAETGGESRVFLSDLEEKTTRVLTHGNQISDQPRWSPYADILLYKAANDTPAPDDATAVLENVATGEVQALDLLWPAAFGSGGDVIYSPAFVSPAKDGGRFSTTFVPTTGLDAGSQLDGAVEWFNLWRRSWPVGPDRVVALAYATGCDGIQVYKADVPVVCIDGGTGASVAPNGEYVAMSRLTGMTGQISYPGGGSVSLNVYEVVIVDVSAGTTTVVASGAISDQPPLLTWNKASSRVLVEWPVFGGL